MFTGILRGRDGEAYPLLLMSACRVSIRRHVKIRGDANPYDPESEGYFEKRLHKKMQATLAGRGRIEYLWRQQEGRCGGCGQLLDEDEEWQVHHRVRRSRGGSDRVGNLELLHANCHRQKHSNGGRDEPCRVSQEALEKA